jgi:hypothetical protein
MEREDQKRAAGGGGMGGGVSVFLLHAIPMCIIILVLLFDIPGKRDN